MMLDLDAFQARGKTGPDQLHQEMKLDFPVLARLRTGDPNQPGRSAFDEITDDQDRSEAELHPHGGIIALIAARLGGSPPPRNPPPPPPLPHPSQTPPSLTPP